MEQKVKLSKGILELKFMKRTKEKVEQQEDEEDREQLYSGQLSVLQSGSERVSIVPSHYECYDYLPCRLSFGGFEPETEKMNLKKLKGLYTPKIVAAPDDAFDGGMEVDVPAAEVSSRLKTSASKLDGPMDQQQPEEGRFYKKDSKVNRFDKVAQPNKFNKNKQQQNNKSHNKKWNKQSSKRKSEHIDEDEDTQVKERKFLKPSP